MLAGFERRACHGEVQYVRRADVDRVNARIIEYGAIVARGLRHSDLGAEFPALLVTRGGDCGYLDIAQSPYALRMDATHESRAENGGFQFFHRHHNVSQKAVTVGEIMVVRVRFARGRQVQRRKGKNRRFALALSALLTPAAVM